MADGSVIIDTELDSNGLSKGLSALGGIVSKGIVAATAAIGAMGAAIIKVGSDFEAQMSRVKAISGATGEDFTKLTELAKKLGADTAFSASEAAAGMENLASAGFDANQIMGAMPGLLDLAAVSGGDVAAASEVAASALNAFGLEASKAGHVADIFARAAADTNAECLDMGEAMKYVAPVAKNMGLSIEETAAAIGIMSDAGIKGSQAGTTLRSALSRLAKPTKIMQAKMKELNLSFYDAQGNMIPLKDQVAMLQKSFSGLTQEQKSNALVTLYGQESLSGMMALIESGPDKLDDLTTSLINSDGAAREMAATIQDNLQGALENLSGSAETLGISIYESLSGPLQDIVKEADGYMAQLQDAFTAGGLEGLVSAAGDVLGQVVTKIAEFAPKIMKMGVSLLQSLIQGLMNNSASIASAATEIGILLIDAIINIGTNLLSLGAQLLIDLAKGIASSMPTLFETIVSGLNNFFQMCVEFAPKLIEAGINLLTALASGIQENLPTLISSFVGALTSMVENISVLLPELIGAGLDIILALVKGIVAAMPSIAAALPKIITSIVTALKQSIPVIITAARDIVLAIVEALPQIIQAIIEILPDLLQSVIDILIENVPTLIDAVSQIVMAIAEALPGIILAIVNVLPTLIQSIVDGLTTLIPMLIECGMKLFTALIQALPQIISTICQALPGIINGIISALLDMLPMLIDCGVQLLVSLVQALPDIIYAIVNVLPQIIQAIINTLVGMIPTLIECGIELLVSLVKALPEIIITIVAVIPQIISSIIRAIIDAIPLLIQAGIQLLVSLIGALPDIIVAIVSALPEIISSIIKAIIDNIPLIIQAGIDLLISLVKNLPKIIIEIVKAAPQIVKGLVDAFGKLVGQLADVGMNMIKGIWDGIKGMGKWLWDKFSGFIKDTLGWVADILGIHSPSTVFRDFIGKNMMIGLALGIEQNADEVESSMTDVAKSLADTELSVSPQGIFDDVDTSDLYARVAANVSGEHQIVQTYSQAKIPGQYDSVDNDSGVDSGDNSASGGITLEGDVYLDSKKVGRTIAHEVSKQIYWEGK
jgi:TP901 family phage tail tape measure protein